MSTFLRSVLWLACVAMLLMAIYDYGWLPLQQRWLARAALCGIAAVIFEFVGQRKERREHWSCWLSDCVKGALLVVSGLLFIAESTQHRFALTIPFLSLTLCTWRLDRLWFGQRTFAPIEVKRPITIWQARENDRLERQKKEADLAAYVSLVQKAFPAQPPLRNEHIVIIDTWPLCINSHTEATELVGTTNAPPIPFSEE